MSKIGQKPIVIPQGVTVTLSPDNIIIVKGQKGELQQQLHTAIDINIENNNLTVTRKNEEIQSKEFHGLYRSLINNMLKGVHEGFKKQLELIGVGYKAAIQGNLLDLSLGYSHNIIVEIPKEVAVSVAQEKGENPTVTLECINKQLLGEVAAQIRKLRKPEPYQGKGVRYKGEYIYRKAGKAAGK